MVDRVSVVGLGKLGLGLAVLFADSDIKTIGIDVNADLVDMINSGKSPGVETEMSELVFRHGGKNLRATLQHQEAIDLTDITYLLVATPSTADGHFSNAYVESALEALATSLAKHPKPYHLFVIGSTVSPGAVEGTFIPLIERCSGRRINEGFGVCYDPEFVALGSVVKGFREPDLVIIGESDRRAGEQVEQIHQQICTNKPAVRHMAIIDSEIAKVSLNVYLTVKISFANMLAGLCERIPGANVDVISDAIGRDSRIAPHYLRGGLAYGGPCFPRDTRALSALARSHSFEPVLVDATEITNEMQDQHLLARILQAAAEMPNGRIGVFGLSFKPDTDVITESPSLRLVQRLIERKLPVVVYDPHSLAQVRSLLNDKVTYAASVEDCIASSSICVIANPDRLYKAAIESYRGKETKTILDCWRVIDRNMLAPNLAYLAIGLAPVRKDLGGLVSETAGRKSKISRVNILGVGITTANMEIAVREIEGWIERREPNFVLNVPAHCIVECLRNEELRKIYNRAGLVNPDGMPIAWITRWMGHRHVDRVYGPDLMLALCERSLSKGYRHFLYGGWPPEVVDKLATRLRQKFPGIEIVGQFAPPFRALTPEEDREVVQRINATNPDIVWIGLGAAKEEYWAESHLRRVTAPALIGVGAAFDFHAGVKPQAPRWVMRAGLEWFFRMLTEPRRLGPRYLKDNPIFLWNILLQALGREQRPL
jgi:UDPglucose 6-dehydrogenase